VRCSACGATRLCLAQPDLQLQNPIAAFPCWTHRGCRVLLLGHPRCEDAYLIRHSSGAVLGRVGSLAAARQLIDEQITLLRQRLAASA